MSDGEMPMESIEIGSRRLAWRSVGAGAPLLLVNGYAATAADWDPVFLAALGEEHEVICPDNRGVGASALGELPRPLDIDAMAGDLEALLDVLEIERVSVAGWSMGGFIGQALARRAPERVAALTLIDTDPGGEAAELSDSEIWARLTDSSGTPREQATRLLSLLFPPPVAEQVDREFGEVVAAARAALDPAGLRAQEDAIREWHTAEPPAPPAEPPPVLVAHGAQDAVIPAVNAELLGTLWSSAQVEVFPGCGHALMAQEPERLASLIAELNTAATA